MKKIILVGYMGSGKTTIGLKLSQKLNIEFIDLDQFIEEKEGLKVADIFKIKGEVYFRKQENTWFNFLINFNNPLIISVGGGTPCYANNHLLLKHNNVESIYLKANVATLVDRLKQSTERPLLHNITDLPTFIAQHLFERTFYYNFCKYTIDVNNKETETICQEILGKIR